MSIIGVIPARYASSRFPGKPLADICGKPMVWWVYQQAKKSNVLDNIIVATDDIRISDVCDCFGIQVIMTSNKHRSGVERLAEIESIIAADIYILIQGDEPLIEPELISELSDFAIKEENDSIITTFRTPIKSPSDVVNNTIIKIVADEDDNVIFASRSAVPYPHHSIDFTYYKSVGVYSYPQSILHTYNNFKISNLEKIEDHDFIRPLVNRIKIKSYIRETETISIDTPKDLERVCNIMQTRLK